MRKTQKCWRNVMTVGTDLGGNPRLGERAFQQAGHTVRAAAPRARHGVEEMSHPTQPGGHRPSDVLVPGVAVARTYHDSRRGQRRDRFRGPRQLRRHRHLPHDVAPRDHALHGGAIRQREHPHLMRAGFHG